MMMKNIMSGTFIIALLLIYSSGFAQSSQLQVELSGLRNNKGHVLVSLFKSDEGFPNDPSKAVQKLKVAVNGSKATAKFNEVPSGVYAVAVLHDENDDLKMDKNFVGIPKEGFGFSNNVMRLTGPPSFKEASFELGKNEVVAIVMRY